MGLWDLYGQMYKSPVYEWMGGSRWADKLLGIPCGFNKNML